MSQANTPSTQPVRPLSANEIDTVAGGHFSAIGRAIKSIGEALSTAARKG